MEPLKVVSFERTCTACPSQWEGKLHDGRMFYVRERHGQLSVNVSPEPTDTTDGDWLFTEKDNLLLCDSPWGGYVSNHDMVEMTRSVLDFSEVDVPVFDPNVD